MATEEWTDLDWAFLDEEGEDYVIVDETIACRLENPETCEACD